VALLEESSNTFTAKVEVEICFHFLISIFSRGHHDPVPSVTGKLVSFFRITFIGLFTFIGPNRNHEKILSEVLGEAGKPRSLRPPLRGAAAGPHRAQRMPHQYGNYVPMVTIYIFWNGIPTSILYCKPLPSSPATSAQFKHRPAWHKVRV
jgi:hypothetical protein